MSKIPIVLRYFYQIEKFSKLSFGNIKSDTKNISNKKDAEIGLNITKNLLLKKSPLICSKKKHAISGDINNSLIIWGF